MHKTGRAHCLLLTSQRGQQLQGSHLKWFFLSGAAPSAVASTLLALLDAWSRSFEVRCLNCRITLPELSRASVHVNIKTILTDKLHVGHNQTIRAQKNSTPAQLRGSHRHVIVILGSCCDKRVNRCLELDGATFPKRWRCRDATRTRR